MESLDHGCITKVNTPAHANPMDDESMDSTDPLPRHVSLVVVGHLNSGKSTLCGRLLLEMGSVSDRELEKLTHYHRYVNWNFTTDSSHYTIFDAPGHRYDDTLSLCFQPFNASLFGTANITKT